MNILLTGASGFLGQYILETGISLGFNVTTIGRNESNEVNIDLSKQIPNLSTQNLDIVIHAAGKAHSIPKTKKEIDEFYAVNYQGTVNLVNGIEQSGQSIKQFIFISTVAVYGLDYGTNISEDYPLNGNSPYAQSKIQAENYLLEWSKKTGTPLLILRLPLVIGLNPKGNLEKMINGIKKGRYVSIGGGIAHKSMVNAEDVAECCFNNIGKSGIYNLTDGQDPSFRELENRISFLLNKTSPPIFPLFLAKIAGKIGDFLPKFPIKSELIKKMSLDLTFNSNKAKRELNWQPSSVIEKLTIE